MSAAKKKKNKSKNKKKKLRVESTQNVLNKSEMEAKDKAREEAEQEVELEVLDEIIQTPKIPKAIQNIIDSAEEKEENVSQETMEVQSTLNMQSETDDNQSTKVVPAVSKELIKVGDDEKPEYVKQMLAKKRRKMILIISIIGIVILALVLSTIFAILNSGSAVISKGVKVKGYDLSKLSPQEARVLLLQGLEKELAPEITLKYNDYENTFTASQIEFEYDVDKAVDDAYDIGKKGNIVENNYQILFASLFGKNINLDYKYNEDSLKAFVTETNSNIPGVVVEPSYYREDDELFVTKGKDGLSIDKEKISEKIIENIIKRNAKNVEDSGFSQEIVLEPKQVKAEKINMAKIYEEIHTEPKDAYYELEPYKLYPDVEGVDLTISVEEAQKQVDSKDQDEYSFKLNITKAEKTIKDLGLEAFPYVISEFTTKYDASNVNRSINLAIAAKKIDGTVLMPGEEFSYNKVVGKRTVEEGYKDAKIYADGGVVDGLAGGICQISSTLYNAVLLANLEITERHNHTYTTSYLPGGRDATVVWGTKDFKFKNTRNYPVKIEASVKNGIAEFKFHGIAEETEYEIKILPVTTSSIPFSTVYEEDPTLAPGQMVTKQGGHSGCRVTTYKETRLNGTVISKEVISNDTYDPMRKIVRVGPGAPEGM